MNVCHSEAFSPAAKLTSRNSSARLFLLFDCQLTFFHQANIWLAHGASAPPRSLSDDVTHHIFILFFLKKEEREREVGLPQPSLPDALTDEFALSNRSVLLALFEARKTSLYFRLSPLCQKQIKVWAGEKVCWSAASSEFNVALPLYLLGSSACLP